MIPKKLTLKGVFSYKTTQIIDFEALTSAGLFGIFGRVGSGKSSILEAILFALYGHLPRLGTQGRWENLMHLQCDEALIEFEFQAQNKHYMSRTQQHKKRKKNGSLDKIEGSTTYYIWENEAWTPYQDFDAAKIIGLNYKDFMQTVIIPQNSFQNFLERSATDRTRMLQEIFNLNKYDLEAPTKALIEVENQEIARIEGSLKSLGTVSETDIDNSRQAIADHEAALQALRQQLETAQAQATVWAEIKAQKDKQADIIAQQTALYAQKPHFDAQKKTLERFELAQIQFKAGVQQCRSLQTEWQEGQNKLNRLNAAVSQAQTDQQTAQKALEQWQPEQEQREQHLKMAQDWRIWAEIGQQRAQETLLNSRQEKGKTIMAEKQQERLVIEDNIQQIETQLRQQQGQDIDILALTTADNWYKTLQQYDKKCSENEAIITELKEKVNTLRVQKKTAEAACRKAFQRTAKAPIDFAAWAEDLKKQQNALQEQRSHTLATQQLGQWAAQLVAGDPCPVCGATHHPSVWNAQSVENELKQQQEALAALETQLKKLGAYELEIRQTDHSLTELATQMEKATAQYHQNLADRQAHTAQKATHLTHEAVVAQIATYQEQDIKLKALRQKAEKAQKDLNNWHKEWEKYQSTLISIEQELAKVQGSIAASLKNMQVLTEKDCQNYDIQQAEAEATRLTQHVQTVEKAFNTAKIQQEAAERTAITSQANLSAHQTHLAGLEDKLKIAHDSLQTALKNSEFETLEAVEAVLNLKYDLVAEKKAITQYEQAVFAIDKEAAILDTWLKGKTYDVAQHATLLDTIADAQQREKTTIKDLGAAQSLLKQQQKQWQAVQTLWQELEKHQDRHKNLSVLKTLFSKSGFVNYVSTIFLRLICHSANARFKSLTQHQLQLELDEKNNFIIRDMANGGLTRTIKTLSGGQLFQVSLALALALSDHIQSQQKQVQKFFFLDEGFGALDRESLSVVFEALKALRHENRIVGVISHIEEMQEEITAHLRIELDADQGSIVKVHFDQ